MKTKKVYVITSAFVPEDASSFGHFQLRNVVTSMKLADEWIKRSMTINKGTDLVITENLFSWKAVTMYDYKALSTDDRKCKARYLVESHELNHYW